MKSWDELNAMERAKIAERLPVHLQSQLSFPMLGTIWDTFRSWVLDTKPPTEEAALEYEDAERNNEARDSAGVTAFQVPEI